MQTKEKEQFITKNKPITIDQLSEVSDITEQEYMNYLSEMRNQGIITSQGNSPEDLLSHEMIDIMKYDHSFNYEHVLMAAGIEEGLKMHNPAALSLIIDCMRSIQNSES